MGGRPGFPQHRWFYSETALYDLLKRCDLRVDSLKRFAILPATILSSVGLALFGQSFAQRNSDISTEPPSQAHGLRGRYVWLQYFLRYRLGAYLPPIGPQVAFVCAVPNGVRPPAV